MQVHCRLREIMRERGITVEQLHRMSGAGREAISTLRGTDWRRVDRVNMGRICGALGTALDELFVLIPADIWAPIKTSGEMTLHYGSRSLPEAQGEDTVLMGQYVGGWDLRAYKWISEYLKRTGIDVSVTLQEHVSGPRGFDPSIRESVRQIFAHGNHVILGSPIANQNTEEVVCHAHSVPPYAPQKRDAFPYGFVWDSRRSVISSFGWQGIGGQFGIASTRTGKLVAHRTMVKEGEGQDCALILVHRLFVPPARRQEDGDSERVIICILGHSGAGTLAGAMVATDPQYAAALYPSERGKPLMRVVSATYTRAPIPSLHDNREVTGAVLVEDVAPQEGAPEDPSSGPRRSRREMPARAAAAKDRKVDAARRLKRGDSKLHAILGSRRGR